MQTHPIFITIKLPQIPSPFRRGQGEVHVMTKTTKQKNLWQKFLGLHEHKKYLEFFTALLSIPVLITVIILNLNSLHNLNKDKDAKPTDTPQHGGFFAAPIQKITKDPLQPSPTSAGPCKKELGPVSIDTPEEGDTITDNPVSINISYDDQTYCAAVWAYRINGGSWSDYDDKSIALYNLPQGKIKFELKAKSVVVKDETTITRNFTYKSTGTAITPTPTLQTGQLGASTSAPTPEN